MVFGRYGNICSGLILEKMLKELGEKDANTARKYSIRVTGVIHDCYSVMKELSSITNMSIYETIWTSFREHINKRIDTSLILPQDMINHLHTAVTAIMRNARRHYIFAHPNTPKKRREKIQQEIRDYDKNFEKYIGG